MDLSTFWWAFCPWCSDLILFYVFLRQSTGIYYTTWIDLRV